VFYGKIGKEENIPITNEISGLAQQIDPTIFTGVQK